MTPLQTLDYTKQLGAQLQKNTKSKEMQSYMSLCIKEMFIKQTFGAGFTFVGMRKQKEACYCNQLTHCLSKQRYKSSGTTISNKTSLWKENGSGKWNSLKHKLMSFKKPSSISFLNEKQMNNKLGDSPTPGKFYIATWKKHVWWHQWTVHRKNNQIAQLSPQGPPCVTEIT